MFYRSLFVAACALHLFKDVLGSSDCKELPVFSPSQLVVKYNGTATATCSICNGSCDYDLRLEEPFTATTKIGKDLVLNVAHFHEWSLSLICYIFASKCQTLLNVTVYQPPEKVSVSFKDHKGPLSEGQSYSLQCEVEDVAPAEHLTVAFYRDSTELQVQKSTSTEIEPVSGSFTLNYTVTREDHGAQFWCEARLELGPEGPQPPPVVRSQHITANVHYKPHCKPPRDPELISVTQGQSVQLNCSTDGNPSPHYSWTVPSASHPLFSGSIFSVESASLEHEGRYTCNSTNELDVCQMMFNVKVHVNYLPIIIAIVAVCLFLAVVGASVVYLQYYKQSHTGEYNLIQKFRLRHNHAVPTME